MFLLTHDIRGKEKSPEEVAGSRKQGLPGGTGPSSSISFGQAERFLLQLIRNVASVLSVAKKKSGRS